MKPLDLKTSPYFSTAYTITGGVMAFIGLLTIVTNPIVGLIILLISFIFLTTHYRLRIDLQSKTFFDYLWILGFKTGAKGGYETIEYLYINKSKVNRTMNCRSLSTTIPGAELNGYIKFSEAVKVPLISDNNKSVVKKKLNEFASRLHIDVRDYTEG